MSYKYVKAPPGYTLEIAPSMLRQIKYHLSLIFITLGIATFTTVAYPIISYELTFAPKFQKGFLSPEVIPPTIAQVNATTGPEFTDEIVNTAFDYTDSNNWFNTANPNSSEDLDYAVYTLSIPKLGIDQAVVRSDHTDLKQSLIQYPGTALPGNLGNTVIFGHSVLPQFFNPQNYLTIFSTLHKLKIGDTIDISADGAVFTYKIAEMYETQPNDLSPLAQSFNNRFLTLITCTPPGTYLRRLIIRAYII